MSTAHNVITGASGKTNDEARDLYDTLVRSWGLPRKQTKDGELADVTRARELAQDEETVEDAYGHRHAILAASLVGENYERGQDAAVDAVLERAAETEPDNQRAAIDKSVVVEATPIQVDPQIVDIQQNSAPLLDYVQMEAQAGFTAQYSIISDRNAPTGRVSEADSLDLTDNDNGDFTLGTETEDMVIYVDRVSLSDFTQRAEDSLGYMDVEETTLGQRVIQHAKFIAGEMLYGDPDVKSDGSIQGPNAAPGLARIASDADSNSVGTANINGHVIDKSGYSGSGDTPLLDDIKSEITDLVTGTGADYSDLVAVTSGDFFDTVENEANVVTRLSGYDENVNFGGRQITLKQGVPLREVRAVGRSEHAGFSYNGTGETPAGNFDPAPGDVFIFDQSTFRHRQLAPMSTVPLGRRGLADEAAIFEYSTNIDKSHGAHVKYLQGYSA